MRWDRRKGDRNVRGALIGKYFLGVFDDCWRSGIVESVIDDDHYLVRFNAVVQMNDGSPWPESLAVVAITEIAGAIRNGDDDAPPRWLFFDDVERQQAYEAWLNEPAADRKPQIVPLRPDCRRT